MSFAAALESLKPSAPKVLTIDIETSPHLAWTFSTWQTNISPDMIVQPSRMLSFAAKWLHTKTVHYYSEHHHERAEMISAAHGMLDEADVVVTYNGPGFDEKHLRREFLLQGLAPPSPFQSLDLLKVVRSQFKLPSNRLGQVGSTLGIGAKVDTGGWRLWQAVLDGDPKAWALFKRYNVQDVRLTEDLLRALGPWVKSLPNLGLWSGDVTACPACGSKALTPTGWVHSGVSIWPKFRCDSCGAWSKLLRSGHMRPA